MNTLKMKITGFDENSNSIMVAFASDETAKTAPEEYPSYAFQPYAMFPDAKNIDEIVKKIAYSGIYTAQAQARDETVNSDPAKVGELRNLVGQSFEFSVADLQMPTILADSTDPATGAYVEDALKTRVLAILSDQGLL